MTTSNNDTKKIFREKGMCSHTFFYLLNREFGHLKEAEETASDPLAGGILRKGHQCGMLWGAALAAGAESFRRYKDRDQAIASAMTAAQHIMASFTKRTGTPNCLEITGCDMTNIFGFVKFLLTGKTSTCFNLAENWFPEAAQAAKEGLQESLKLSQAPISCASEVAKKMGASDEEAVTVAGLAGGMGLSGSACGALGAAIWMVTLAWCRENPLKSPPYFKNKEIGNILKEFKAATGSEFLCHKICNRHFKTIDEHTEFIKTGGCDKLIDLLAANKK